MEAALAAEHAGLASAWIAEHHFISYGVCPSAVAFAANILGRTGRITVGPAVCMLSNRHPVALAEETALLDHLSAGRFHLGVGRGGPWVDLEVFGTGLARYDEGFGESLDLLLASLERGSVAADGERGSFFRFREIPVVPRPSTSPRPPVAVAATSAGTVELAAARGLPLILGMHAADEEKAALLALYATVASRHGHDPDRAEHMAAVVCHIADSRAGAVRELSATMPAWIDQGVGEYVTLRPSPQPRRDAGVYVEHLLAIHPVGTPEYCAERLTATIVRLKSRLASGTHDAQALAAVVEQLRAKLPPAAPILVESIHELRARAASRPFMRSV